VNLKSQIFRGEVTHERLGQRAHAFSYPMTFFAFDLEDLSELHRRSDLFGYNDKSVLTIRDRDYLNGLHSSIGNQLDELLGPEQAGESTLLVTSPRYFGYAFNPVNFHLRLKSGELLAAVVEVNNTFGDRHIYTLTELTQAKSSCWMAQCPKDFHVSPFNDMAGEYRFTFHIASDEIFLGVDLYRGGECVMKTWIQGAGYTLSSRSIARYALLKPFDTALNTMPRILWQAGILYFRKHMQVYKRPSPISSETIIDRDQPDGIRPVI